MTIVPDCALRTKEILLFQASLAACAPRLDEFSAVLSPDERARKVHYRNATRRLAFVAGRAALRAALGTYLGIPPDKVRLSLDSTGKPRHEVIDDQRRAYFNISHSSTQIVIGITDFDGIGVDVEDFDQRMQVGCLVRNYFSPAERAEWTSYLPEHQPAAFVRGWTRKEAAWKFFGHEEEMSWKNLEVTLDANPHTRVRARSARTGDSMQLHCFSWSPTPNSVATVAVRPAVGATPRFQVRTLDFADCRQFVLEGDMNLNINDQ